MTNEPEWEGESRRIGADLLHDQLGGDLGSSEYLVAEPPPMAKGVVETLRTAGVAEEQNSRRALQRLLSPGPERGYPANAPRQSLTNFTERGSQLCSASAWV
jgi:hypothetical protein